MASEKVRVGLIGLGKMGISHQAILHAHPNVELVGICDTSQYVLDILKKYTGIAIYSDFKAMIDTAKLDAVVVATPSRFHAEMVRYALEHDLHVFCEKPFCLDLQQGQALVELAASKKLINQVGYHYRYVEAYREAYRLLRAGVIGDVHHVRAEAYGPVVLRPSGATWRTSKTEGGGCLYDYASHALDLVEMLVGSPTAISGVVRNRVFSNDVEDEVYASLHFANGVSGQLAANWSDESHRKMSTKVSIWGKNGRLAIDRQECQIYLRAPVSGAIELPLGWTIRYTTDLIEPVWYYLRGEEYSKQIDAFVKNVRGQEEQIGSTFASALATDRVIEAIAKGAESGRLAVGDAQLRPTDVLETRGLFGLRKRTRR
jgi:scyllo-inositol 2-dehydrogenase (NADP+)